MRWFFNYSIEWAFGKLGQNPGVDVTFTLFLADITKPRLKSLSQMILLKK